MYTIRRKWRYKGLLLNTANFVVGTDLRMWFLFAGRRRLSVYRATFFYSLKLMWSDAASVRLVPSVWAGEQCAMHSLGEG